MNNAPTRHRSLEEAGLGGSVGWRGSGRLRGSGPEAGPSRPQGWLHHCRTPLLQPIHSTVLPPLDVTNWQVISGFVGLGW